MLALTDIEAAATRLQGQLLDTPCVASKTLSQITGAEVFLKFENLQYTASFKERGACNKLAQLSVAEGLRGVVAMSAGNHAQGVAYHAQRLGLRAVIVMPRFTPGVKIERTRGFGAEVVLHGDTLDESRTHALGRLARIRVSARDVPGSLARITATVADAGANIDEVHHQRAFTMLAAQNVDIELVIQTRGRDHIGQVLAVLQAAGFEAMEQHG